MGQCASNPKDGNNSQKKHHRSHSIAGTTEAAAANTGCAIWKEGIVPDTGSASYNSGSANDDCYYSDEDQISEEYHSESVTTNNSAAGKKKIVQGVPYGVMVSQSRRRNSVKAAVKASKLPRKTSVGGQNHHQQGQQSDHGAGQKI